MLLIKQYKVLDTYKKKEIDQVQSKKNKANNMKDWEI